MTSTEMKAVSPTSLESVFNKNPLELSDEEIRTVVEVLRKDRLNWKPEEKKKSKVDASANISLDDIEL